MWEKVLGAQVGLQSMQRKAWLDAFLADGWGVFGDGPVGDLIAAGLPFSLTIGFRAIVIVLLGIVRALRCNAAAGCVAGLWRW